MAGLLASVTSIVCGVSFSVLPPGWHHSRQWCTTLSYGVSDGNTDTWAATPRSVDNLLRFPRSGTYIWVSLNRPTRHVEGSALRLPLRLRDATLIAQKGAPSLPEYRFEGRYRHQYEVIAGVDFGRPHPSVMQRRAAQRVLDGIVWPRWR